MRRIVCVVVLGLMAAGCGPTIRTTMLGQPHPPDTAAGDILVFSARLPECPFEEIALVSSNRSPGMPVDDMDALLASLRQQAHRLGGHAVVGLTERPKTEAEGPSLVGTVIRFTSPDCRPSR